jgi:hypothetical protein
MSPLMIMVKMLANGRSSVFDERSATPAVLRQR